MIAILDYGYGNIKSIFNAFKFLDIDCKVIKNFNQVNFKKLILPGVGAFSTAMDVIKKNNFENDIKIFLDDKSNCMLGICLGMQLLATLGREGEVTSGLDLIKGETHYLKKKEEITHHVGWNNIKILKDNKILKNIKENVDFYFCHSIFFNCSKEFIIAESKHNISFPAVINKENIYGIQFHPEKSLSNGLQIFKNFSEI